MGRVRAGGRGFGRSPVSVRGQTRRRRTRRSRRRRAAGGCGPAGPAHVRGSRLARRRPEPELGPDHLPPRPNPELCSRRRRKIVRLLVDLVLLLLVGSWRAIRLKACLAQLRRRRRRRRRERRCVQLELDPGRLRNGVEERSANRGWMGALLAAAMRSAGRRFSHVSRVVTQRRRRRAVGRSCRLAPELMQGLVRREAK